MNILIIGCGRVGSNLAMTLAEKGHDISVLDASNERLDRLRGNFSGLLFCGVPIDNDVLRNAGIASCEAVCAVTDEDNLNIMVSEMAKTIYHIPIVLTRVFDGVKGEIFDQFGLHTICSTALTVDAICSALDEYGEEQYIVYGGKKVKFYSLPIPKSFIGIKAKEIDFEEGEVLFGIIPKDGTIRLINNYNVTLNEGDALVFTKIV